MIQKENTKLTNIKIKNFKSISDLEINLEENSNINLFYGINGSGKTTLIETLRFIRSLFIRTNANISSLVSQSIMNEETNEDEYLDEKNANDFDIQIKNITSINFFGSKWNYKKLVTKDLEDEPISISLKFKKENENYDYFVVYGQNDVILEETLLKNGENIFLIQRDKDSTFKKICVKNSNFEISQVFFKNLTQNVNHSVFRNVSFVSILKHFELDFIEYDEVKFDVNFISAFFESATLRHNFERNSIGFSSPSGNLFRSVIMTSELKEIWEYEQYKEFYIKAKDFSEFLMGIDESILGWDINHKISKINNEKLYHLSSDDRDEEGPKYRVEMYLEVEKKINKKIRKIPFFEESTGTQNFVYIYIMVKEILDENKFPLIVFDELGKSFNETLLLNIFNYIEKIARLKNKQMIITTHNTILLHKKFSTNYDESKFIWNKEKKIIFRDALGRNGCIDLRGIDKKENNQLKYLLGAYKGNYLKDIFNDDED